MKPFSSALAIASAIVASAITALPAAAAPAQTFSSEFVQVTDLGAGLYSFSQSGFAQGAAITGSFTGFDTDGNFQLSSFNNEISNFSVSFSGNNDVGAWSSTIGLLAFDLNGSSLLGDGLGSAGEEGISTQNGTFFWDVGPGPYNLCDGSQICGFVGSNVPEPSSWTMLIAGFGLAGAMMRRRRAAIA